MERWIPLEANPEVFNDYMKMCGCNGVYEFCDVFTLDSIPPTTIAAILLYPLTERVEAKPIGTIDPNSKTVFVKQKVGNACGTIALVHSLCNNADAVGIKEGTPLDLLMKQVKQQSPGDVASLDPVKSLHFEGANKGQTDAPPAESNTNLHFVAFVVRDGMLYELDGRREAAVCHGPATAEELPAAFSKVAQSFMERDPSETNFNIMALARKE